MAVTIPASSACLTAPASRPRFPEEKAAGLRRHIDARGVAYVLKVSGIKPHLLPKLLSGMPILEGNLMLALAGLERLDAAAAPQKPSPVRRLSKAKAAAPIQPLAVSEPPPAAA